MDHIFAYISLHEPFFENRNPRSTRNHKFHPKFFRAETVISDEFDQINTNTERSGNHCQFSSLYVLHNISLDSSKNFSNLRLKIYSSFFLDSKDFLSRVYMKQASINICSNFTPSQNKNCLNFRCCLLGKIITLYFTYFIAPKRTHTIVQYGKITTQNEFKIPGNT